MNLRAVVKTREVNQAIKNYLGTPKKKRRNNLSLFKTKRPAYSS